MGNKYNPDKVECKARRNLPGYNSHGAKRTIRKHIWQDDGFVSSEQAYNRRMHLALKGLTLAEYNQMLVECGGLCAICGDEETAKTYAGVLKTLSIDHDHNCCPPGRACSNCRRELICADCNRALGMFNEDPEILLAAAAYLLKWRK